MSKKWFIVLLAVILIAVGGFFGYQRFFADNRQVTAEEPTLQTATVTRGDIVLTASGSGNLLPATEIGLGFSTSGTLLELNVQVGDQVEAGDVLARLDDTDARTNLTQAEINLRQAEIQLAELTADVDEAELATAQANLISAQENLNSLLASPDPDEVEQARMAVEKAKNSLWAAQMSRDAAQTDFARKQAEIQVANAEMAVREAEMNYEEVLAGPTEAEIAAARAQVAQAQAALDELLAGASPEELEVAQLNVELARRKLAAAQADLEGTVLKAPFSGVVTAVDAEVGEAVGTSPIITLANTEMPLVRFWVEESDLSSVAVGNPVNITFEALPDYTFPGEIISVEPTLVTVDGTSAVQVWATIDLSAHPVNLLFGMTAEVEVVAGEARNALLVPVEALRELGPDQYAVFVVKSNGELELRPVEVGLKDYVNAEIISGLEEGEVVSTGESTGSSQSVQVPTNEGPGGGPMFIPGVR